MSGAVNGLAHHFESHEQQRESSFFGMWVFIAQEILFFTGVFAVYLVYRSQNPEAFRIGSNQLDIGLGAFNTAVLIGSSLTMALAVWAASSWGSRRSSTRTRSTRGTSRDRPSTGTAPTPAGWSSSSTSTWR